jgi:hypothetical protein
MLQTKISYQILLAGTRIRARSSRVSSRYDTCLRLCDVFGVGCVTAEKAMVVSFLNTATIFAIDPGYEVGLCAMYSRQSPVNRYSAKS